MNIEHGKKLFLKILCTYIFFNLSSYMKSNLISQLHIFTQKLKNGTMEKVVQQMPISSTKSLWSFWVNLLVAWNELPTSLKWSYKAFIFFRRKQLFKPWSWKHQVSHLGELLLWSWWRLDFEIPIIIFYFPKRISTCL